MDFTQLFIAFSAKVQTERFFNTNTIDVFICTYMVFFMFKKIDTNCNFTFKGKQAWEYVYIQANLDGKFLVSKADVGNRKLL